VARRVSPGTGPARPVRRDLDTVEELTQDTFVAAIEKWRQDGVPDNPAAWLYTTARYLAVDRIRRRDTHRNKVRLVAATSPQVVEDELTELVDPGPDHGQREESRPLDSHRRIAR
jgi:predicted RNA polymerase sigma factor